MTLFYLFNFWQITLICVVLVTAFFLPHTLNLSFLLLWWQDQTEMMLHPLNPSLKSVEFLELVIFASERKVLVSKFTGLVKSLTMICNSSLWACVFDTLFYMSLKGPGLGDSGAMPDNRCSNCLQFGFECTHQQVTKVRWPCANCQYIS